VENLVLLVKACPESGEPAFSISWLYGMDSAMKELVIRALLESIDDEPTGCKN
jgi:hypothetical protein